MIAASSMHWLIGIVGVSSIALIGVVMTLISVKRHPGLARWSASAGLLAMVLVSIFAVLPTPGWCIELGGNIVNCSDLATAEAESSQHGSDLPSMSQSPGKSSQSGVTTASFDVVFDVLHQINAGPSRSRENVLLSAVPWLILLSIVLGLSRFAIQGISLYVWARRLEDVEEPIAARILENTRRQLGCSRQIRLCCASDATDAAVIGWRKPSLVLPADYSHWPARDLQSVIAHEVSHVRENDFAWRAVFRFLGAFYLFNPCVHLFYRCFVLAQERVSDVTASGLVGHESYMQSVSRFALKRDRMFWGSDPSLFSPVFSGEVIRRIKMLKEYKSIRVERQSKWIRLFTMFVFASLVLVVVGFRVAAAPPSERVARLPSGSTSSQQVFRQEASRDRSKVDPTSGMFDRSVISPDELPENDSGMFHYNVKALTRHAEIKSAINWINTTFAKGLQDTFGSQESPIVRLSEIESIIGLCNVTLRYMPGEERPGRLMLGSSGVAVTFNKRVDLEQWMHDFVPEAERMEIGGTVCYKLPIFPRIGPTPLKLAVRDSGRTLCLGGVLDYQPDSHGLAFGGLVNHTAKTNQSGWSATYRRSSGGLVTAATSTRRFDLRSLEKDSQEEERLVRHVLESCHSVGVGVDWNDEGMVGVRIRFATDNEESAQESFESVKRIRELSLESEKSESKKAREFLESMFFDVEQYADGSADVLVHGAFSMTMAELILDEFASSNRSADETLAE